MFGFSCIFWFVTVVVLTKFWRRYLDAERDALLSVLTIAAERGMPLHAAVRGFAMGRRDRIGRQGIELATYLESGELLGPAMRMAKCQMPQSVLMAAEFGQRLGMLGPALRMVQIPQADLDATFRQTLEKLIYFAQLFFVLVGSLTFIMLKIVPVFAKMFQEFELELPQATVLLINLCNLFRQFSLILFLLLIGIAALATLVSFGLLPGRYIPLLGRIWWVTDGATIFRFLGKAVQQERSLLDSIRAVHDLAPTSTLRSKLAHVAGLAKQGGQLWESLRSLGLIQRNEMAVLESAERSGNLAWALNELADRRMRRMTFRLRFLLSLAIPALSLGFGMVVAIVVIPLFMPLISLIQGLS